MRQLDKTNNYSIFVATRLESISQDESKLAYANTFFKQSLKVFVSQMATLLHFFSDIMNKYC